MNGWIEKIDGLESVDGSRLNDLTLNALEIFKRKKDRLLITPPNCMSELSKVS
jgi:hypothetical protein